MLTEHAPPASFASAFDLVHEVTAARVGSEDFGADDYHEGLKVLLQSMDYDPRFTETGRAMAWGQVIDALAGRAIAVRSMKANPGFAQARVERPIVIVGVPRTGTTALHKLMAVDPRFQGLEKWLLGAPMPRPPRETWESDPHFAREVAELEARFAGSASKRAAHNMVAEEVDECLWLQRQSFVSNIWASQWSAGTYDAWWRDQDETASYRYLADCVRLIGMNEPGRRWLLKNPSHILHLDLLFAVFPDALVIHTHRDPAKAVISLTALMMQIHPVLEEGRIEARGAIMARREAAKWARGVREAGPVRRARSDQVLDVVHGDFHADPMGTIERIYRFIGMDLPPEVETAMRERIAAAPERSHGVHAYRIEDFAVTPDEIRAQFGDYVERFGLVTGDPA